MCDAFSCQLGLTVKTRFMRFQKEIPTNTNPHTYIPYKMPSKTLYQEFARRNLRRAQTKRCKLLRPVDLLQGSSGTRSHKGRLFGASKISPTSILFSPKPLPTSLNSPLPLKMKWLPATSLPHNGWNWFRQGFREEGSPVQLIGPPQSTVALA